MSPTTGRRLGFAMLGLALVGGVALFVTRDGGGDDPTTSETTVGAPDDGSSPDPSADGGVGAAAAAIDAPILVAPDLQLTPVAEVPGATALRVVGDEVRVTDGATGALTTVDATSGEVTGTLTFGSQRRIDRAVPDPDGGWWSAEADELHRLDADGEVLETVVLEVPSAIHSVDADAVWLTVAGVPAAHSTSVAGTGAQSYLQRVDRATGEVVARAIDDPATFRAAIADDGAWVTVGRTLYLLDRDTLEPVAGLEDGAELVEPASALVRHGDEVLVVVGGDAPVIARFAAADLAPRGTVALGSGSVGPAAVVRIDAVTATEDARVELWVLRPGDDGTDGRVTRVDLAAETTVDVAVPAPRRIEVDDAGTAWLLSGAADGTLLRLDPS